MSRATVRAGLVSWLTNNVTGLTTVYRDIPTLIPGAALYSTLGASSGCVAAVRLSAQQEMRTAVGGANSGKKRVDYDLELRFGYQRVASAPTGGDAGLLAADDVDSIIENVLQRIRADRTAGGTVWEWGEGASGISASIGEPVQPGAGQGVQILFAVYTQVTEFLTT